jgi:hypothetical protein
LEVFIDASEEEVIAVFAGDHDELLLSTGTFEECRSLGLES